MPPHIPAPRHDGWTAARRAHFLLILAQTESVTIACAAVGKSRASAYQLRRHPRGAAFAVAWDEAVQQARDARIMAAAIDVAQRLRDRIARHAPVVRTRSGTTISATSSTSLRPASPLSGG
jgi:hypothetical protein